MNLISSVLICALVLTTSAKSLKNLIASRILDVGSRSMLHLGNDNFTNNSSFLEKDVLRMGFSRYGIRFEKPGGKEAVDVGFYRSENDNGEGRGKKMEHELLPIFMGFKMTGLVAFTFTLVTAFVIKALGIAKLALIGAAIVTFIKLLHPEESYHYQQPAIIEVDHAESEHVPVIADYAGEEAAYHPSATGNYYAYNYAPSAAGAESAISYVTVPVEAAANNQMNSTVAVAQAVHQQQQAAVQTAAVAKRRNYSKRKSKIKTPLLTIHRYSIET